MLNCQHFENGPNYIARKTNEAVEVCILALIKSTSILRTIAKSVCRVKKKTNNLFSHFLCRMDFVIANIYIISKWIPFWGPLMRTEKSKNLRQICVINEKCDFVIKQTTSIYCCMAWEILETDTYNRIYDRCGSSLFHWFCCQFDIGFCVVNCLFIFIYDALRFIK